MFLPHTCIGVYSGVGGRAACSLLVLRYAGWYHGGFKVLFTNHSEVSTILLISLISFYITEIIYLDKFHDS